MQRGTMTGDAAEMAPSVVQRTKELTTAPTTAARSPWLRYGAVPVAVAVALLCRLLLWPVVGPELPYLFFWPAVVFAAWYGGLRAGLLATFLSALAVNFSLFWPRFSWVMARPTDLIGIALFAVLGAVLSFLVEKFQQRIRERRADLVQANAALRLDESRLQALLRLSEMAEAPEQQVTDFVLEEAIRL